MNWKQYQNELIVLGALLVLLFSYVYKHNQTTSHRQEVKRVQSSIDEIKEVVALKKIWGDKSIGKKIDVLHNIAPKNKVKWMKKGKKLTAYYTNLTANELNKLITKMLNMPVSIHLLEVNKINSTYKVDFKCKW